MNILRKRSLGLSVIKEVCLISEKAKSYAYKYFKIMEEYINPTLYAWVAVEGITVKVAKFRDVPL